VLPDDWESFTLENVRRAEGEIEGSISLRDHIDDLVKETNLQLHNQGNDVDSAFNTRLAQYNDFRNEAKSQLAKVATCSWSLLLYLIKNWHDWGIHHVLF
jgi:hypothetical protein